MVETDRDIVTFNENDATLSARGHHLVDLAILMGGRPPYKGDFTRIARIRREGREKDLKSKDREKRKYAEDCIGKKGEKAQQFESNLRRKLKKFWFAKDEEPFVLLEGQADSLVCVGCAIGFHCHKRYQDPKGVVDVVGVDGDYMKRFITLARFLEYDDSFTIDYVTAQFSDSPPQRVRRLTTTIGTTKSVLKASLSPVGISFLPPR